MSEEDRQNLLKETVEQLQCHGKMTTDVRWVGTLDGMKATDWNTFAKLAATIDYDAGYGGNEIPLELVVVGDDWWLERGEYDGSEWWEYKTVPVCKVALLDRPSLVTPTYINAGKEYDD